MLENCSAIFVIVTESFTRCSRESFPWLTPFSGVGPFAAPSLGDFSGELAGLGDSAGLGNSDLGDSGLGENALEAEASLGLGDCDKSEPGSEGFAVGNLSKSICVFSDEGRGWLPRPLSGRRVCIGSTGPHPGLSHVHQVHFPCQCFQLQKSLG